MPTDLAYSTAMRNSRHRFKMSDPELLGGSVEMIGKTRAGVETKNPWASSGQFAIVYKFRTQSGALRAVRCFRGFQNAETEERYEEIGRYFEAHIPTITAGFKYHPQGLLIKEDGKEQVYPIVEMTWIEGKTLVEAIDALCRQRDKPGLRSLSRRWLDLVRQLRDAGISHGDLAGDNVLVQDDGQLKLVDYDGVYVPALKGRAAVVAGKKGYQHPQRETQSPAKFDERVDDFSALLIYTALLTLSIEPQLWRGNSINENLLFEEKDLLDPTHSPLIEALELLADPLLSVAVQALKQACLQPIDQAYFPPELLDPDFEKKLALARLEKAIAANDEQAIVRGWVKILTGYALAQVHFPRVELAQQRQDATDRFHDALCTKNLTTILDGYDFVLDQSTTLSPAEHELVTLASRFKRAEQQSDDDAYLAASEELQRLNDAAGNMFDFTTQEQQHIIQARLYQTILRQIRAALQSKDAQSIAQIAGLMQDAAIAQRLSAKEFQQVALAHSFIEAYDKSDEEAMLAIDQELQKTTHSAFLTPTPQQRQFVILCRKRAEARSRWRAVTNKNSEQIATAYDTILDGSTLLTADEHAVATLARAFADAWQSNKDANILAAAKRIRQSPQQFSFAFSAKEQERIELAQQRQDALKSFRRACASKNPREIAAAYLPLIDSFLTVAERALCNLARSYVKGYDIPNDLVAAYDGIQQSPYHTALAFTAEEQARVEQARGYEQAMAAFQRASRNSNAQQIIDTYYALPLDPMTYTTDAQRKVVAVAKQYLTMRTGLQTALRNNDEPRIAQLYKETLAKQFTDMSADEQRLIEKVGLKQRLGTLLDQRQYTQALRIASDITNPFDDKINSTLRQRLSEATRDIIKRSNLEGLTARIVPRRRAHSLIVNWRWPENNLVRDVVIIWSPYEWPEPVQEVQLLDHLDQRWERIYRREHMPGSAEIDIGFARSVFLRAYAAMVDEWSNIQIWYFSSGEKSCLQVELSRLHR